MMFDDFSSFTCRYGFTFLDFSSRCDLFATKNAFLALLEIMKVGALFGLRIVLEVRCFGSL